MFYVGLDSTVSSSLSFPCLSVFGPLDKESGGYQMPGLMQLGKTFPAEKQQGQNPPVSMSSMLDELRPMWLEPQRQRREWTASKEVTGS